MRYSEFVGSIWLASRSLAMAASRWPSAISCLPSLNSRLLAHPARARAAASASQHEFPRRWRELICFPRDAERLLDVQGQVGHDDLVGVQDVDPVGVVVQEVAGRHHQQGLAFGQKGGGLGGAAFEHADEAEGHGRRHWRDRLGRRGGRRRRRGWGRRRQPAQAREQGPLGLRDGTAAVTQRQRGGLTFGGRGRRMRRRRGRGLGGGRRHRGHGLGDLALCVALIARPVGRRVKGADAGGGHEDGSKVDGQSGHVRDSDTRR